MAIPTRAQVYAARYGLGLVDRLGFGKDGIVWATNRGTALKVHERAHTYERERDAYGRLRDCAVTSIRDHTIPLVIAKDDELLGIEMTIVQPPYLLDFSSVDLDEPPDFAEEVMEQWREEKREQFEDRWPQVELVLAELRARCGMYLFDIHPGNITFSPPG
jgi:hypothetical protein